MLDKEELQKQAIFYIDTLYESYKEYEKRNPHQFDENTLLNSKRFMEDTVNSLKICVSQLSQLADE